MRLRNIPGSREKMLQSTFVINNPQDYCGKWSEAFGNENPIEVEIGMGKGQFLIQKAIQFPNVNFIGIEKYSSVLLRAVTHLEEVPLFNIRLLRMDAEDITACFGENEVDKIYLNFSDPWPKDRHAKRRLTSKTFLKRYEKMLKPRGTLYFKTDNRQFFNFSLEELAKLHWNVPLFSYDLYADDREDPRLEWMKSIVSEYEERFVAKGNAICAYIASPPYMRQEEGESTEAKELNELNKIKKPDEFKVKSTPRVAASDRKEQQMELKLTEANFQKEVLEATTPVVVDFYADWCGPCKMMAPVVAKMADQYAGSIKVGKCNIDENMALAQKYGVSSIPTFIRFENGEIQKNALGAMTEKKFEETFFS
jgi:tRNA (guanine-N7-)-methyltransferase